MSESTDRRADTTRQQLLHAAAHQFAQRAYHDVGLDDVLAEAELTKGAMYFHFRSKHALALAVIDDLTAQFSEVVADLLSRKFSGLETLIDFSYQLAIRDITEDIARAGFNLLESIGRAEGLQLNLLGAWIQTLAGIVERAIAEGDIFVGCDPHDVGQLLVSIYTGLRQTSNLDEAEQFLRHLEKAWALVLTGIVGPDRVDYFKQFIGRRTALAISSTTALTGSS
jgi:TetR/AcrR family transcriptional regulator, transcriptional repressor for nem operon